MQLLPELICCSTQVILKLFVLPGEFAQTDGGWIIHLHPLKALLIRSESAAQHESVPRVIFCARGSVTVAEAV
jgi:hypothetical protein